MKAKTKRRIKVALPEGWMGKACRRWLQAQAASCQRIVEVGVWKGRSTSVLAQVCPGVIWAVDHWQGTPHDEVQHQLYAQALAAGEAVCQEFLTALAKPIRSGKVVPVRMASIAAAEFLGNTLGRTLDLVFLDGDHSYEAVRDDIAQWRQLVRPGGMLAGHDYAPRWTGVRQAVDEAFGARVTVGPGSIWSITL